MTTWDGLQMIPTLGNDNLGWVATVANFWKRQQTKPLCRASPLQSKTLFTREAPLTKIRPTHELTPLSRSLVQ
eukprot:4367149-Amphidinium_carterae.1